MTKLSKYIYVYYEMGHFMTVNELVQLYYTLIYPRLIYCITVWGGCYESILKPVLVLQDRILRAICSAGFRSSADPIYQRFKLLKLKEIYRYTVGSYVLETLDSVWIRTEIKPTTRARQSVMQLLKVSRVTSVQASHSFRLLDPWLIMYFHSY